MAADGLATVRFRTLFPFPCNNEHTCHPPFSLTSHLYETDLRAELWVVARGPRARARFVRAALPRRVLSLLGRANNVIQPGSQWARWIVERRFAAALRRGDAAHLYRGCSLDLLRTIRARGHMVFLERINMMDHAGLRIITDAFARAGWPADFDDPQKVLDEQQAQIEAVDFIFSPSPLVTASLRERGIQRERILETSYGWDPERFRGTGRALPEIHGVTLLFVGNIGMRKGAHLLLDAWARAGITGRLVLVGRMEALIAIHCADHLRRSDVIHLDYNPDLARIYGSADVFAFPTLEEGSALVTYEAMGNGLPIVTSPMGAGDVIRHRREGLIVEPHNREELIAALRELASDAEKRKVLGEGGRLRAADYTWDKVAKRRYQLIKDALATRAVREGP